MQLVAVFFLVIEIVLKVIPYFGQINLDKYVDKFDG